MIRRKPKIVCISPQVAQEQRERREEAKTLPEPAVDPVASLAKAWGVSQ